MKMIGVLSTFIYYRGALLIEEVLAARRDYLAEVLSRFSREEAVAIQKHLALLYEEMKD